MLEDQEVLAFDLGASSGRALIGRMIHESGGAPRLKVEEIHRFPNGPVEIGDHLYWDILRLLEELKTGLRKAFQDGYSPRTFGIDTWGVDFGLLDANGELMGNPYHYRDPHTQEVIEDVVSSIGKEALFEQSGLQLMPFNTVYQLAAMKQAASPKLDAARTLLLTPDLLVYFLTGRMVCEFTMATTTQLYHPSKQAWNTELMDRLSIPPHLFLEVIHPGTAIAPLTQRVCKELGVPPVEAVAVGTHDTESAAVAVPCCSDESFVYLVCGTWSLMGTEREQPLLTEEAARLEFSNEGGVGGTYQLLKNIMGLWILQECKAEWDGQGSVYSYSRLVQEAAGAEPFRSLIDPDDFRFYSPHDMIGKIQAFCLESGQPVPQRVGEITRCVLESLALKYKQTVLQIESLTGESFQGLHMVGGGIQNELLCQLTANALARPVWAGPVEASAIGNMLVQYMSTGHCKDLQTARRLVADSFPIRLYEPQQHPEWVNAYLRFTQLQARKEEEQC
ncbi:rhamnulokinase [Paenibacillus hexagrammi]|uniref:Rhamnulokinase n=1 Tax=Paenibacillus hexagrammi TaxID=2908839 RepID=A0ABY3SEG9_9BACL|nr:rhamnulokinase family protein [Paenibacillus sp. YPD9-1]UJF32384.1 rhamnulokinase [Paenibacillus sp. YPD9-1]